MTWEKMSFGGGLVVLQFSGSLKRAVENFIPVQMSPLATF